MDAEQPDNESKPELNIIQAIELAIGHETEARKSYLSLSQETDDPELKVLLKEIAMEEASQRHRFAAACASTRSGTCSGHFFPLCEPGVVRRDFEESGAAALGGRRQVVTVLFADIRNFTSMSEAMAPEAVASDMLVKLRISAKSTVTTWRRPPEGHRPGFLKISSHNSGLHVTGKIISEHVPLRVKAQAAAEAMPRGWPLPWRFL